MKTRYNILVSIIMIFGMFFTQADGLGCSATTIQYMYDTSDSVFYGVLDSKQHDSEKHHLTTMNFTVYESFKGISSQHVIVKFNEGYDKKFEQGYEYVVFAQGTKQPLEIELCGTQPYAFPTIVNMISQLDDPDNSFGPILEYDLDDYLTEPEKMKLEGFDENFAKERQKERDRFFGQLMLIGIPAIIGVGVVIFWIRTMKQG